MCSETDVPPGSRGECELLDGDLGDLDSDLGSESDLLHVLEKVTVLCFSLLPLPPSCLLSLEIGGENSAAF